MPESVSEYESSEYNRVGQLKSSLTKRRVDLQERNDRPGLVALSLQSAERYRALGAPLAQAESLHTASIYESRPELAESYARQAVETLRDMPPSTNKLDREARESYTVEYAMHAANLALRHGDKVDVARGYAELVKPLCNAPIHRFTAKKCDVNSPSGHVYREVMARLGDPTARALMERDEQKERAEVVALAALADRMRNSRRRLDHADVVRSGAELSDRLAKRHMAFLAAMIELDRAESFHAMGDAASAEASEQMARRRIMEGLGPSGELLQREAEQAAQLALPKHAKRLQDEAAAVAALSTRRGLSSMDGLFLSHAEPRELQETRATLVDTIEQLQSRGAHLSAEYARHRLREVSAAYQTRVADLAAERAAAQRQRAEDERRDREGWAQLRGAVGFASGVAANIDANKNRNSATSGGLARPSSGTQSATSESCRCGPDYISCLTRHYRSGGMIVTGPTQEGTNIKIGILDKKGEPSGAAHWDSRTGQCGAVAR